MILKREIFMLDNYSGQSLAIKVALISRKKTAANIVFVQAGEQC